MLAAAASTAHQQCSMRSLSCAADTPSRAGHSVGDAEFRSARSCSAQRNHRACCSKKPASANLKSAHASSARRAVR
eukprot:4960985-Prymnesium_polylepis.1